MGKDGRATYDLPAFKNRVTSSLIYTGTSLLKLKEKSLSSTSFSPAFECPTKKRQFPVIVKEQKFNNGKNYRKKSDGKSSKCNNEAV